MQLHSFVVASFLLAANTLFPHVRAQDVHVSNVCEGTFKKGQDTALVTLPYSKHQVLDIIGDFKNLTWSGNPDNTVTLNGTNNTPGTARTYTLKGPGYSLPVTETLITYDRPLLGPYYEVHNSNLTHIPGANIESYIPYDGTIVSEKCLGQATVLNFTAHFCSNKPTAAANLLHTLHTSDGENVGKLLGGKIFKSCNLLGELLNDS